MIVQSSKEQVIISLSCLFTDKAEGGCVCPTSAILRLVDFISQDSPDRHADLGILGVEVQTSGIIIIINHNVSNNIYLDPASVGVT